MEVAKKAKVSSSFVSVFSIDDRNRAGCWKDTFVAPFADIRNIVSSFVGNYHDFRIGKNNQLF